MTAGVGAATGAVRAGAAMAVPVLNPGECQVWFARSDDARAAHDTVLHPSDVARRARLRRSADRRRSTVAAAIVRIVVGAHLGIAPAEVPVDRTCAGCGAAHAKPRLPRSLGVQFSVSHSGGCVAVAVSARGEVGIDVEEIGRLDAALLSSLGDVTLAESERAELALYPADQRGWAFTTYWTRKEAVLKATGDGLLASVSELVVSPPSSRPRVLRWAGHPTAALTLHTVRPPGGWVGALATLGEPPDLIVERDAGPMLRAVD